MRSSLKWLFVIPVAVLATAGAWAGLTVAWSLVALVNVVPQNDVISLAIATFGINATSTFAGVHAASRVAPSHGRRTAAAVAGTLIAFAFASLAVGTQMRSALSMSYGWHLWSSLAWVIGAVVAAVQVKKAALPVNA